MLALRHPPRLTVLALALAAVLCAHAADEPTIDFTVVESDTLRGLSNSVLTSPTAWREVAKLNRLPDANRITPGQVLKIPTRLLRADTRDARVVSTQGEVRVGDSAASDGQGVKEGQSVQTGPRSSAVLELADGSRVRLPPSSLAQVMASRQLGERTDVPNAASPAAAGSAGVANGWFVGTMRVVRGSVEVFATKVLRAKPLEVVTPTAVVGVRGTRYRVSVDEAVEGRTRGEVVEGLVRFDLPRHSTGTDLPAGFGAVSDASVAGGTNAPAAVRLQAAPDLAGIPSRFERPLVRFALPAETVPLHVQVARDEAFDKIVVDQQVAAGEEVRIAGLDDASWHLRARRVDGLGLEGLDAQRAFVLKARPEPPIYNAPRSNAKQQIGPVAFAWAQNVAAPQARLQIAEDEAFTRIVEQRVGLDGPGASETLTRPGVYYWRLASVRPNGDAGPYGDPQRFELRPQPEPPTAGRSADGNSLIFKWGGRPQDKQRVELARDPAFTEIVAQDEVNAAEWVLPKPSRGGRYYFRYRSIEPDGYTTPYSEVAMVEVPRDWSLWLLLLPLVLL